MFTNLNIIRVTRARACVIIIISITDFSYLCVFMNKRCICCIKKGLKVNSLNDFVSDPLEMFQNKNFQFLMYKPKFITKVKIKNKKTEYFRHASPYQLNDMTQVREVTSDVMYAFCWN